MATFWSLTAPAAPPAVTGDIWINTGTNVQSRRTATAWTAIVPPDTRGDVIPLGGQLNDRLAKVGGRAWEIGYANAADGVVKEFDCPAAREWELVHALGVRFVDVSVLSPGNANAAAVQTIVMPEVEFVSSMMCRLHFVRAVGGTAIIRR